jgi:hypothetical protein
MKMKRNKIKHLLGIQKRAIDKQYENATEQELNLHFKSLKDEFLRRGMTV